MRMLFGERFTPKQAAILDMIATVTKGRGGICMESMIWVFYPGEPKKAAGQRIRTHIDAINNILCATDYRIIGPGMGKQGMYRLARGIGP